MVFNLEFIRITFALVLKFNLGSALGLIRGDCLLLPQAIGEGYDQNLLTSQSHGGGSCSPGWAGASR